MTTLDVYLERIDQGHNMARYYRLSVVETLFGEWVMVREWGRIGSRGQSREHCCASPDEAAELLEAHRSQRVRRGYR
jgi:predicted DNA-binding WGR domain protein